MRKLSDLRKTAAYQAASAKADFVSEVEQLMGTNKIRQNDLADLMGVKPPQVSRWFRGDQNVTLKTMVRVAAALGRIVRIHLARPGVLVEWTETTPDQISSSDQRDVSVKNATPTGSETLPHSPRRIQDDVFCNTSGSGTEVSALDA